MMIKTGDTLQHAAHGKIVNYELLAIVETLVEAKCGLWVIHELLSDATTMAEIRARFARWQAEQCERIGKDH